MMASPLLRWTLLFLTLLSLTSCIKIETAGPPAPTQDPTQVAVAAEATVTALAAANIARSPTAPAETAPAVSATEIPTVTPDPNAGPAQAANFWVTYLLNHRLALINGDGSKTARLTNTPGFDHLPTWSPDGMTLAFLRFDGTSRSDGVINLLAVGSNTPRALDPEHLYSRFVWLPDSRRLLATGGYSGNYEVYQIDADSGQRELVAKQVEEYPALSPDGKQAALLINTGAPCDGKGCTSPSDLFLLNIATRQTIRVTGDEAPKTQVIWSPDGQQLAYNLAMDTTNRVDLYRSDGKLIAEKQIRPWWYLAWVRSPDGKQVAYAKAVPETNSFDIYAAPLSGDNLRYVVHVDRTPDAPAMVHTLRWRPDGSGLVFNNDVRLYTVNLDGSGLRELPVKLENVLFDVRTTTGDFTPPPEPTAPASWKLCPGGMESRLEVGRLAQVSTNPPSPNNVRSGPGKKLTLLGQIQPGEKVMITGGPYCDNGLTWWEVRAQSGGLLGWTLEGDEKTYWLVPVP